MLPYWESDYDRDDGMARLVVAIVDWSRNMSDSNFHAVENRLHGVAQPREGWLSFPGEQPIPIRNNCPADLAGDSIVSAANAIMEHGKEDFRPFVHEALRDAVEAIARVMGERQPEDETTDFWSLAVRHLQEEIQKRLIENGCPGS
jgi:hypothetical protein